MREQILCLDLNLRNNTNKPFGLSGNPLQGNQLDTLNGLGTTPNHSNPSSTHNT